MLKKPRETNKIEYNLEINIGSKGSSNLIWIGKFYFGEERREIEDLI
jgi:hypothetical protein